MSTGPNRGVQKGKGGPSPDPDPAMDTEQDSCDGGPGLDLHGDRALIALVSWIVAALPFIPLILLLSLPHPATIILSAMDDAPSGIVAALALCVCLIFYIHSCVLVIILYVLVAVLAGPGKESWLGDDPIGLFRKVAALQSFLVAFWLRRRYLAAAERRLVEEAQRRIGGG